MNTPSDAVPGSRRVAAAELALLAAAIVETDFAQEPRVDHGVDAETILAAVSIHVFAVACRPRSIVTKGLDLRGRQPWRQR